MIEPDKPQTLEQVAAVANAAIHRLGDTDRALERFEGKLDAIQEAQKKTDEKLDQHTDQISTLSLSRFAWPPLVVGMLALFGGFGAVLLYLFAFAPMK